MLDSSSPIPMEVLISLSDAGEGLSDRDEQLQLHTTLVVPHGHMSSWPLKHTDEAKQSGVLSFQFQSGPPSQADLSIKRAFF